MEVRQAASVSALADGRWRSQLPVVSRYALLRRLLACADLIAALMASVSLVIVGDGGNGRLLWSIAFLPVWILVGKLLGLYDRDESSLRHLTVDELPQIALWSLVCTSGLSLFLGLTPAGRPEASSAIIAGLVAAMLVVPLRVVVRWGWRRSSPIERVAVIGARVNAEAFKRKLELFSDLHMSVVEEREDFDLEENGRPWLESIDRLVMTPDTLDDPRVAEYLELLRAEGVLVTIVPPPGVVFGPAARLDHIAELSILQYRKRDLPRSTLLLKRMFDVSASAVALVVLLPLLAIAAIAILVDTGRPVIFSQLRAGQNGRPFRMHKLRTMVPDAEELLPSLIPLDRLAEPVFKIEHDPRVTRVGRWLRRWSVDELPQLVNVLRGEMSLVGPRPEQVALVERYSSRQRLGLMIKPGLTGPMQVHGRGALGLDERVAVDEDYIENLSLGRDARILAMTLSAVVRGKGAF